MRYSTTSRTVVPVGTGSHTQQELMHFEAVPPNRLLGAPEHYLLIHESQTAWMLGGKVKVHPGSRPTPQTLAAAVGRESPALWVRVCKVWLHDGAGTPNCNFVAFYGHVWAVKVCTKPVTEMIGRWTAAMFGQTVHNDQQHGAVDVGAPNRLVRW
jgi:hypothetical protein